MTRTALYISLVLLTLVSCMPERIPIQPGEVPEARPVTRADEQYGYQVAQLLSQHFPLANDFEMNERVRRVVQGLAKAAGGGQDPWKVYVYESRTFKNAAATRGHFVFVWTGLLQFMRSDDELATVLSHEIGHVLAGHTDANPVEESRSILSGVAGQIGRSILTAPGNAASLGAGLAGMAIEQGMRALIVNPELQRKEYEADQIGLFLMADAGYNPEEAIRFWQRASRDPDLQGASIEVLSSHPSSSSRLQRLEELMPQALTRYEDARFGPTRRYSDFSQIPSRANPGAARWISKGGLTPVFASPSIAGEIIGQLEPQTLVEATDISGSWIRIDVPERGYVRSSDLMPAPGGRRVP